MDDGVWSKIFSAASGVWAMACMLAVALFKAWPNIMARLNERQRDNAAEKAGDWERLRAERDNARSERDAVRADRDRIHALWIECEEEKLAWQSKAVSAEATLLGLGNARQREAERVAAERIAAAKVKDEGSK